MDIDLSLNNIIEDKIIIIIIIIIIVMIIIVIIIAFELRKSGLSPRATAFYNVNMFKCALRAITELTVERLR